MKTKLLKRLLLVFSFYFSALVLQAQIKEEQMQKDLDWLNENTQTTHRYGGMTYNITFYFTGEGLEFRMYNMSKIFRWREIDALSETTTGRIYIHYRFRQNDEGLSSYEDALVNTDFEYVTPKDGVSAREVMNHMLSVLENLGRYDIKGTSFIIGDADEIAAKKKEQANQPQLTAEDEALLGFFDLLGEAHWEFSGAESFDQLKEYEINWSSSYKPVESYGLGEVRLLWAFGNRHFRFNVSPFAFTWMTLPSFKKFDPQGVQYAYDDFGVIRYYSPALGFTYALISKKELREEDRFIEFPLTVNFAPLLGSGKTETEIVKNKTFDSEFGEYFQGLKYNLHASFGFNMFFGKGFGWGLTVGGTYVNVKATKELLTERNNYDEQRDFTYQFDKLSPFIPTVQLKLILR